MANHATEVGFHYNQDAYLEARPLLTESTDPAFTYTFENFFHPYVGELIEQLNRKSLTGLLDPNYHESLAEDFFETYYTAVPSDKVELNHFPKEIDVRAGGPYANYNWELLFHVP